MANFEQLKATVANVIKTNGEENITGAIMQDVLLTIINSIAGGYMFGGVAQHSGNVGNPDYNVFYLAGSGAYTGYGGAITIPDGCYGVFLYNGTWSQEVVDIGVHLTGDVATGEQDGVTGGRIKQALDNLEDNINTAINELASGIRQTFESLLVSDVTAVADKLVKITEGIRITAGGQIVNISTFDILAATAEKAGLMSAADKQKLDGLFDKIRTLSISDTTSQGEEGVKIVESLFATLGDTAEVISTFTILAATTSKAGLMSAADKTALDTLPSLINAGYLYAGIATPSTVPSSTDAKIFYIAIEGGTYTSFGNLNVTQGINIIYKSGNAWSVAQVVGIDNEPTAGSNNLVKSGGVQNELALGAVYDVSAKNPTAGPNNDGKFESLSALLSDANINTLIPTAVRKGGMSVKFVCSSDNKYVQYRLMSDEWSTNTDEWSVDEDTVEIENPEFVDVTTDADDKVLHGILKDGDFYFGNGIPRQIQEGINKEKSRAERSESSKVDKVSGKSLIDEGYANECATVEDSMWLEATTDSDSKILEGITANGEKVIDIPVSVLGNKLDYIKNPEFSGVLLDNEGRLIEGMLPNGKHYLALPTNQDDAILEEVNKLFELQKKEKFIDISRDNFDYHEECIFHDDFVREAPDSNKPWLIGSNSSAVGLDKYDYVSLYENTVDDGFRLSESEGVYSLTNVASDVKGFRLIKTLTKKSSIVAEINNNSAINKYQSVCFNVNDANNYELLRVHRDSVTDLVIEYAVSKNGVELHRCLPLAQKYNGNSIRFYFIGKQLRILLDDIIVFTGEINDAISNLGLLVESTRNYSYKFFNIYYVQTEKAVTDNTGSVDNQITEGVTFTAGQSQTIDPNKEYCYTLVNNVVDFGYCEKFEVRNNGALTVTDDRQENMFIPQKLPILGKFILSFDLMFPSDFVVDETVQGSTSTSFDCFFQLHESAADAMSPCIMLSSEPSANSASGAGVYVKIESLKRQVDGFYNPDTQIKKEIYPVEPGKWHHFDILFKQGYLAEHNPLTVVLIDGKEYFKSVAPNSYNVAKQDYPKYGMYKPMWSGGRTTSTNVRSIYFDNVKITY